MNIAEAAVKVVGDFNPLKQQATQQGDVVGKTLGQRVGAGLKTALTAGGAVAGALAIPLLKMGDAVKELDDNIRVGTGLLGEELKSVQDVAKSVAGSVPEDLGTVGRVVADLQTRTGLMGDDLQTLSQSILDYSRLTGGDPISNTNELTRVFGDWSIATEDQSGALDTLLRTQQATAISGSKLQQLVVAYGGPMRQLGFSFEETAALLGKFEAEGVNTELVMGSMRVALGKMARAGEAPAETLQRVIEQIKGAGSAGEANAMALDLFGARAGPDMAAAIREGRFDLDELLSTIEGGTDTVSGLSDETKTMGDKMKAAFNKVTTFLGPMTEGLAGVSTAIGPMIYTLPLLGGAAGKAAGGLASLAGKLGPKLLSGLLGLGSVATGAGTAIGTAFTTAASVVIAAWPLVLAALVVAAIVLLLTNEELRNSVLEVGGKIVEFLGQALGALVGVFGNIVGWVADMGGKIVGAVVDFAGKVVGFILGIPLRVAGFFVEMLKLYVGLWVKVIETVVGFVADVVGLIVSIPGKVVGWVGGLVGQAGQAGAGILGAIGDFAGKVVSTIIGIPGRAVGWIASLAVDAARAGAGLLSAIVKGVGNVISTILGIPGKVITGLVNGFGNMGRAAVDAFLGFIRGIPGAVGDILGGVGDFIGGLIPSFDVGSYNVPSDMLAMVHKGEMIVPAREAEALRRGSLPQSASTGTLTPSVVNNYNLNVSGSITVDQSTDAIDELRRLGRFGAAARAG